MDIYYKTSMFNRMVMRDGRMILYNSFGGTKSLLEIPKNKIEKVNMWLNSDKIKNVDELDFVKLIDKGYIVHNEVDEKKIRDYRTIEYLTDNRLHLVVHVTQACNFRCSYCYMDFKPENLKPDVQEGIINYIRKNIQKYKSVCIDWFGGEPLLGMDIIERISKEVIRICKEQKKPYTAMVTTNGYNLNPENVKRLMSCHVTHLAVTIDGTQEIHDRQRVLVNGKPTFDDIIKNLKYIRDNIKSRTLTVSIRSNITKEHIGNLSDYYSFFDNEFGMDHRFSLFIRPVADYGGTRVKQMTNLFISDMHEIYEILVGLHGKIKFFPNFIDLEKGGHTCTARDLYKYTIGCDGSISKCDEDLSDTIGHLYSDGYMELNEEKCVNWFLTDNKSECDDCFFSGSCFMEICPKSRILYKNTACRIDFQEIDSLIWLAANTYSIETL